MSKGFKQQRAEAAKAMPPARVGIPQLDPGAPVAAKPLPMPAQSVPQAKPSEAALDQVSNAEQAQSEAVSAPSEAEQDPRKLPVDTTVRPIPAGIFMYPDRHRQAKYEAFVQNIKLWEVVDVALEEYFSRKYTKNAKSAPRQS